MAANTFVTPVFHAGAFSADAMQDLMNLFHHSLSPTTWAVSGAIDPHSAGLVLLTKTSAAAMTLAAPTAGDPPAGDDGHVVEIISTTAYAHTITVTALKMGVTGSNLKVTFAAFAGCALRLLAYQGAWYILSMNGGTAS